MNHRDVHLTQYSGGWSETSKFKTIFGMHTDFSLKEEKKGPFLCKECWPAMNWACLARGEIQVHSSPFFRDYCPKLLYCYVLCLAFWDSVFLGLLRLTLTLAKGDSSVSTSCVGFTGMRHASSWELLSLYNSVMKCLFCRTLYLPLSFVCF